MVVRGTPLETRARAARRLADFDSVLWIGHDDTSPSALRGWLGSTVQAVVLDGHTPLAAEVFGQAQGLIGGGGALVLRLPPEGPGPRDERLAVPPFTVDAVGDRFARRVVAALQRLAEPDTDEPLSPPDPWAHSGSPDQTSLVQELRQSLQGPPSAAVVTARRGRGKSSALGLALRDHTGTVCLTAPHPRSVAEVLRFAERDDLAYEAPDALGPRPNIDLVVVDEAAGLSVAWLQQLARWFPGSHLWFATTTEGYEGTGRGFRLRFGRWLAAQDRPVHTLGLRTPIRWADGDPLEATLTQALILSPSPPVAGSGAVQHVVWDHDALANDEAALQAIFGLLVDAHYRTTPGDLQRLLDAPNLVLHTLMAGSSVVAACLLAREGPLDVASVEGLARGRRLRGLALPETLVSHAGVLEAASLRYLRSVRIVTHPQHRRRGLASDLVQAVHAHHAPDAFGTLFGATASVVRFRQRLGYSLVRLGASRGARTGDPAAVMVRPETEAARTVVAVLRQRLAARLPAQVALLQSDGVVPLPVDLVAALSEGLPPAPATLDPADVHDGVRAYAFGPRPLEAAIVELRQFLAAHPGEPGSLVQARIVEGAPWPTVARAHTMTVPVAMRATRRAFAAFVTKVAPALVTPGRNSVPGLPQ